MKKLRKITIVVNWFVLCQFGLALAQPSTLTIQVKDDLVSRDVLQSIESNTNYLLMSVNQAVNNNHRSLILDSERFAEDAIDNIIEMWQNAQFYVEDQAIIRQLLNCYQGYQIRDIPIIIDGSKQHVVISYTSNGRISDFYIGLEFHHYQNVMNYNSVVDRTRREIILNFIENFRTAYVRRDIEFIENVFSDKALIITGRVILPGENNTDNLRANFSERQVIYQVHTKQQYVQRLKMIFNNISYLNLTFSDVEVKPHRKYTNFYGVHLDQYWNASNYSDKGYLFLLIQFREEEYPLIWVRTWQDAKDFNKEEVFGFHNFRIHDGAIH